MIYKSNLFGGFNLRLEYYNSAVMYLFFVVTELCYSEDFFDVLMLIQALLIDFHFHQYMSGGNGSHQESSFG